MSANTRVGDISAGICSVGAPCCPHSWISVHVTGSPDTYTNNSQQVREGDIGASTCPHCPVSFAVSGSSTVLTNGIPTHRVGDIHIVPCGTGVVVTGSEDTNSGG